MGSLIENVASTFSKNGAVLGFFEIFFLSKRDQNVLKTYTKYGQNTILLGKFLITTLEYVTCTLTTLRVTKSTFGYVNMYAEKGSRDSRGPPHGYETYGECTSNVRSSHVCVR